MAAAAAVVVAAVWGATSFKDQGVYAVLEAADGSLYRITDGRRVEVHVGDRIAAQETIRSNDADGAVLALADGSHVEMRSMSELSWDHAADGLTRTRRASQHARSRRNRLRPDGSAVTVYAR